MTHTIPANANSQSSFSPPLKPTMPDLSNLLHPNSLPFPSSLPPPDRPDMLFEVAVLPADAAAPSIEKCSASDGKSGEGGCAASLAEHVRVWTEKKMAAGLPERECALPFLTHAPKLVFLLAPRILLVCLTSFFRFSCCCCCVFFS